MTTLASTDITYDPETRDFAYFVDGELVGFAPTYEAAEASRNALLTERAAQGVAPIEPAQLAAEFAECPHRAWAQLAKLTDRQRVVEAVAYAAHLEAQGVVIAWQRILECWERRLAARAAEAEALLALAEAGAFDTDGAFEDEGREPEEETPAAVSTITVPSETQANVTYQVAIDGSFCTCWGNRRWGHCKHATAQEQRSRARYGGRSAA